MDIHTSGDFKVLSLCTGGYGLDLGLELAVRNARTVCAVEIEAYCQKQLVEKIEKGVLLPFPIWSDLKTFNAQEWRGKVDCIIGGYPCQPFSVAGRQKGKEDPRHLWPYISRIIRECEPSFCFFENVGGHLRLGYEQVHDDLQAMGYKVKTGLFTAEEVGAPHKRERQFILACRESIRTNGWMFEQGKVYRTSETQTTSESEGSGSSFMAYDNSDGNRKISTEGVEPVCDLYGGESCSWRAFPPGPDDDWSGTPSDLKPSIHRMDDGLAEKVDEIRMHGNGVVPLQAAYAFLTLWDAR